MNDHRFADQHKFLFDFQNEVYVHCPQCQKQAVARVFNEQKKARLSCVHCGFHKEASTLLTNNTGGHYEIIQAAHAYFDASLWFAAPFRNEVFWAYNPEHLTYLESYIAAKIREHKDRKHFTLLEKLPKFYHEAKNRDALLKIIGKLKLQQ